jgi:hypothetical protein
MMRIFKRLRDGQRPRIVWGISGDYDPDYEGYLIVFWHKPRIEWVLPFEPTDDIPF